jgi:hypothetical protein
VAGIPTADDDAEAAMVQARKTIEQWKAELSPSIDAIKQGIDSQDMSGAAEAWFELSEEEKAAIWIATTKGGPFSTKEREIMKSSEFRQAHYGETQ